MFSQTELMKPFPPNRVRIRAGGGSTFLCYIDARDVMNRLDQVMGAENWEDSYREGTGGRVFCRLSLNVDGQWISKEDAAGESSFEAEKGAVSDALKRAAVKWGVGRYLYTLGNAHDEAGMRRKLEEHYDRWLMQGLGPQLVDLVNAANPETGEGVDAFGEAWIELGEPLQRAFGSCISTYWPGGVSAAKQKMRDIMTAYRERMNGEDE
jgi:hypothetical protein